MRKYDLVLTSILVVLLYGCQPDPDPSIISTPPNGSNPGGAGNGNGGGTGSGSGSGSSPGAGTSSSSYSPLTVGTWWKDKDSASGFPNMQYVINGTKVLDGITHSCVVSSGALSTGGPLDTGWMGVKDHYYYMNGAANNPAGGGLFHYTILYLNDEKPVGYQYTHVSGTANGLNASTQLTILEKGLTMSIANHTYQDVIHTRVKLVLNAPGISYSPGSYEFYVAKGVGIIKTRDFFGLGVGVTVPPDCLDLIDYHIQ